MIGIGVAAAGTPYQGQGPLEYAFVDFGSTDDSAGQTLLDPSATAPHLSDQNVSLTVGGTTTLTLGNADQTIVRVGQPSDGLVQQLPHEQLTLNPGGQSLTITNDGTADSSSISVTVANTNGSHRNRHPHDPGRPEKRGWGWLR